MSKENTDAAIHCPSGDTAPAPLRTCKWLRKNAWAWRTDCGSEVSVTVAVALLKTAHFCSFCGKVISHE